MVNIQVNTDNSNIDKRKIEESRAFAMACLSSMWDKLNTAESNNGTFSNDTQWLDYPNQITEDFFETIHSLAKEIRDGSEVLLVVGTGGSYMGSRAVAELLPGDGKTELLFLGFDFNERYIKETLQKIGDRDYSLCIISKSGSTMEPMVIASILIEKMKEKYGESGTNSRIYAITEDKPSPLYDYARDIGCHLLEIPAGISGRYSVFTAVGLLPLAVHGVDIRSFIQGARKLAKKEAFMDGGLDYAITRILLSNIHGSSADNPFPGKGVEVFEVFNSYAEYLGNWLRQLFGESEGKEEKGIYPSLLLFNRDLHSVGQFLQEGSKVFFETMIFLGDADPETVLVIPDSPLVPKLSGKTLAGICTSVEQGVLSAHSQDGIPLITIEIPEINPENIGSLMYFFLVQSAVSALMLGVNPFDQPGVEKYKREIKKLLGIEE